jgi:AcrR family transcriptional regulator
LKTARTPTKPRKLPTQERSRATVEAIIQASTYILVKSGWEHLTTNAIAERAGVNIGSLYQYFPNKEAIVAELQRRHVVQVREKLTSTFPQLREQPSLREALTVLVRAMVDEHRVAPAVHRAIEDELPRSVKRCLNGEGGGDDRPLQALQPFMKNVPDPRFALQLAGIAAHAVIHEAASHQPELFGRPDFVGEVVTLLEGYFDRPARKAAASGTGNTSGRKTLRSKR